MGKKISQKLKNLKYAILISNKKISKRKKRGENAPAEYKNLSSMRTN